MISNENPAVVTTFEGKRHGFIDGEVVKVKEVLGMTELNGNSYIVKELSPYSFSLEVDATKFGKYEANGQVEQIKAPQKIPFRSLEESLRRPLGSDLIPEFDNPDLDKWGRPNHLHIALNALLEFHAKNNRLPRINNDEDANELITIFETVNNASSNENGQVKVDEIDKTLISNIAKFAETQLTTHASFWGGIVAQEVVKHLGKFMPLRQWLHYETYEILPEGEVDRTLTGTRYDDYIAIFGREYQEKLANQNFFLIGAGALGCEFLKLFALSGLASGKKGRLLVTDDDTIEVSNLTRQFLFRKHNVKQSKSETAANAVKKMNPEFNVVAAKLRTSPENDNFFNDDFWESLDGITNAVDNIKARQFIDSKCVFYGKPLFESGTLGTKCNSQVIIPYQTQSYTDSQDPEEKEIPACTLKNFPYQIEHTIQWARAFFDDNFVDAPNQFQKYAENPKAYLDSVAQEFKNQSSQLRLRLETIAKLANAAKNASQETCIGLARDYFQETFHNMIAELLFNCPPDLVTESGQKFWSGLKRLPQILDFDVEDETHFNFVFSCANLFAYIFKLPYFENKNEFAKKVSDIKYEKFFPKKKVIKEKEDDTREELTEDDTPRIEELKKTLLGYNPGDFKINTHEFEKDDDTNFHIDFISAVANLRARNYKIDEVPRHKVKQIAGKIIPAIATATAMIVGCIGFEILKFIGNKKIGVFRNSFCNLALPLWLFSEPLPPNKQKDKDYDEVLLGPVKAIPPGWSKWDKIEIQGPKTLGEIQEYFQTTYGAKFSMLTLAEDQERPIFNGWGKEDRSKLTPEEAYKAETGKEFDKNVRYLDIVIGGETLDGVDALFPNMRYKRF